MGYYFVF